MGRSINVLSLTLFSILLVTVVPYVSSEIDKYCQKEFVDAHNEVRAEVGVEPMSWNDTVAEYAQNYANKRSNDCNMEHSGGPYGENIAAGSNGMSVGDAMKLWVGEKPQYDYDSNSCNGDECRHYTQVVWRKSTQLGCASAKCTNGWTFVTCNYYPPGNFVGELPY